MEQLVMRFQFLMVVLACLGLAGCAMRIETTHHLSLEDLAIRHRVCSVAVATIKNRQLQSVEMASGCQAQMIPKHDTVFEVASLSKPVFAYAVLKLVQQGQIALDAPIARYLPEGYAQQAPFWVPASDRQLAAKFNAITVRMALNHTSGLPNLDKKVPTPQANPGEQWLYSGWGYIMLQKAVEAVTRQPLEIWMTSAVFEPLGMRQSSYVFEPRFTANFALPRAGNTELVERSNIKKAVAAYSLHASVEDYSRFVVAVLNEASLLKTITDNAVSANEALNLTWGLGWGVESHPNGAVIWHWGNNPGYRAFVIASTQSADALVMLTNSNNGLALAEPLTQRTFLGRYKIFNFL
jgi:CubicO group peptidase (beta-lactamase class C family)